MECAETLKHTLKQGYTQIDQHTHAQRQTLGDRRMELVRQTDTDCLTSRRFKLTATSRESDTDMPTDKKESLAQLT